MKVSGKVPHTTPQTSHVDEDRAPKVSLYLPTGHASHCVFPNHGWNRPMGHARHCASFVISVRLEYRPAGHGSTDEVPSGQKDPAVHGSHCAAPRPLWNLPPGQAMQVGKPSLGVCVPALQSSGCSLPARHLLPAGQGEHCEVLTRPVAFDHVPAGHAVAIELPLGHT